MSRIANVTDVYVRVDVGRSRYLSDPFEAKEWRKRSAAIVEQVRRHVDDVGLVTIVEDAEDVCSHCGRPWTEPKESPHNGGCCAKDEAAMDAVAVLGAEDDRRALARQLAAENRAQSKSGGERQ